VHLRALFAGLTIAAALWLVPAAAHAQAPEPRDCSQVDWAAVGYTDAEQRGSPADAPSWVDQHRQSCIDVVGVDETAYETGFIQGLTAFCTPRRAFDLGRAGETYVGWCPADQAEAFAIGLRDGRRVRTAQSALSEVNDVSRRLNIERREAQQAFEQSGPSRLTAPVGGQRSFQMGREYQDALADQRVQQFRQIAQMERVAETVEDVTAGREEQVETLRSEFGDRYGEW
jgi:hypothetical protein